MLRKDQLPGGEYRQNRVAVYLTDDDWIARAEDMRTPAGSEASGLP